MGTGLACATPFRHGPHDYIHPGGMLVAGLEAGATREMVGLDVHGPDCGDRSEPVHKPNGLAEGDA